MELKFVKDNEVKLEWFGDNESYGRFLSNLVSCDKKHAVYLDELMKWRRMRSLDLQRELSRNIRIRIFEEGRYCRSEHLEDGLLNDERLNESYLVKLSDKQNV